MSGVRKQTFRMCSWSASRWFLKRSGNTMMVSYAIEPVTRIFFKPRGVSRWIEEVQPVAGRARAVRVEEDAQLRFAARGDALGQQLRGARRLEIFARREHPAHQGSIAFVRQGQLER